MKLVIIFLNIQENKYLTIEYELKGIVLNQTINDLVDNANYLYKGYSVYSYKLFN